MVQTPRQAHVARSDGRRPARGFTLIELLLVVAMVALVSALAALALPRNDNALVQDGERLAALLEAARAQSRTTGVPVSWQATGSGFAFDGLPPTAPPLPRHWLDANIRASGTARVWLGPDPIIAPQAIVLHDAASGRSLRVATDGLRPFKLEAQP